MKAQTTTETILINLADLAVATVKTMLVFAMMAVLLAGIGQF
jgi:hypothetical protein